MILQRFLQKIAVRLIRKEIIMARIIEGERRLIKMSVDDIINIVREYQKITYKSCCYEHTRELLARADFYIPEDIS